MCWQFNVKEKDILVVHIRKVIFFIQKIIFLYFAWKFYHLSRVFFLWCAVKMTMLEGTLSKWTNVMKGWQYRWFVLDENAGLLSYYTVSTNYFFFCGYKLYSVVLSNKNAFMKEGLPYPTIHKICCFIYFPVSYLDKFIL